MRHCKGSCIHGPRDIFVTVTGAGIRAGRSPGLQVTSTGPRRSSCLYPTPALYMCTNCGGADLLVVQVCQLPTILAHPWFERLVAGSNTRLVGKTAFVDWWTSRQLVAAPAAKRLWEVLRPDGKQYLTYADFRPLLQVCFSTC